MAGRGGGARGVVVRLLPAHVPAGLLQADVVAHECADRLVGARRRLARARERRGRPGAGRVDPAPWRDARRAHRAALGGLLSDQELGQLRGGRGAGHAHGGGARRAAPLVAVDRAARGAVRRGDRPRAGDPAAGPGARPAARRLEAGPRSGRGPAGRHHRQRRGR